MPKRNDVQKILVIGSGPTLIGQSGEYDYFGNQVLNTLKAEGYKTVAVNPNPATLMTDKDCADRTYIEPLTKDIIAGIIAKEGPDAILCTSGGQVGLNLAVELDRMGELKSQKMTVLGISPLNIQQCENHQIFKKMLDSLGIQSAKGTSVNNVKDIDAMIDGISFPVAVRPSYTTGGKGGSLVYNIQELKSAVIQGLSCSIDKHVMIEQSLLGFEEYELEVIRDAKGSKILLCAIENLDGVGVHSGDSISVASSLKSSFGIERALLDKLEQQAFKIVDALQICGSASIKFAYDSKQDRVLVLGANARLSRTSAFADKATGIRIAQICALISVGYLLEEISVGSGKTLDQYDPAMDHVAVRVPCWDYDKFKKFEDRLGTQMRSVGAVIGIGKTFKEALFKAMQSADIYSGNILSRQPGIDMNLDLGKENPDKDDLVNMLGTPKSLRPFIIYEALRKQATIDKINQVSRIKRSYLEQIKELTDLERQLVSCKGKNLPKDILQKAKQDGFSDRYLALLLDMDEALIREQQKKSGIVKAWHRIDGQTGSGGGYYSSYQSPDKQAADKGKKILVIGSGPTRVGQGIENDYNCAQAIKTVRKSGYKCLVLNSNLCSVATDAHLCDKLFCDSIQIENILSICQLEKPAGVIVQFGGQTAMKLVAELEKAGIDILGTPADTLRTADDRIHFRGLIRDLSIPQPTFARADSVDQILSAAKQIGFPVIIRPEFMSGGKGVKVVHDEAMLKDHLDTLAQILEEQPVLVDQFLDNAIEVEVDAISDSIDTFVPAIVEQIELAGIHSGDSACVIPSVSIAPKHMETIKEYTHKIAKALMVKGAIKVQYAIFENTVYVIHAYLNASRTIPFVSKVCDIPLASLATELMLGKSIKAFNLYIPPLISHYGIKEAVFPFGMLNEIDPALGPQMRSVGAVLGLADNYGQAFFKAQESTQNQLPLEGSVLFTIADRDKPAALEPVRLFKELGFTIMTTSGTYQFLKDKGIETVPVRKLGYGRPHLVDAVKNGEVHLLVNTPSGKKSSQDNSDIRRAAIRYNIPYISTTAAAMAAAKGIKARREECPLVKSLQEYYRDMTSPKRIDNMTC